MPLLGTTKGEDVFNAVIKAFQNVVSFEKLSSICTDGAPVMKGLNNGFIGRMHKI